MCRKGTEEIPYKHFMLQNLICGIEYMLIADAGLARDLDSEHLLTLPKQNQTLKLKYL